MFGLGMAVTSLFLAATSLSPQDSNEDLKRENKELKQQFESLKENVDRLNTKLELYESKEIPATGKVQASPDAPEAMMPDGDSVFLTLLKGSRISGSVDAGYIVNFNNPALGASNTNVDRVFNQNPNSFLLQSALIMLERQADKDLIVGYRIKLEAGEDPAIWAASANNFAVALEEAYVQIVCPVGNGLDIRVGKMNTLAGAEVIESKDDMNYSRGLLFGYAIPFNHTGIRVAYQFNDPLKMTLGVNNGWNNQSDLANHGKTLEYQLEVKPIKDILTFDATIYYGPETVGGSPYSNRFVFDLNAIVTVGKFTGDINFDYGNQQNAAGIQGAAWSGVAIYGKVQAKDWFATALRFEYYSDSNGRPIQDPFGAFVAGVPARYLEGTLTFEFKIGGQFIIRPEIRVDSASQPVFFRGTNSTPCEATFGTEFILVF